MREYWQGRIGWKEEGYERILAGKNMMEGKGLLGKKGREKKKGVTRED